jgi:hypothetical protein
MEQKCRVASEGVLRIDLADSLYCSGPGLAARRQRSEQYFTWSQSRSHFLRQLKGRAQWAQIFDGSSDFLRIFMAGQGRDGGVGFVILEARLLAHAIAIAWHARRCSLDGVVRW